MNEFAVSDKLKANYDDYYKDGESEWRRLGAIDKVNNIVELCKNYPHSDTLEIGSGEGSLLQRMSDLGFSDRLYSLEISESAVSTIRDREIDSLAECSVFDGYNVPYEDSQFDLAVMSHIVEHLEFPRKLLYEASRVAEYVFVEVPLEDNARMSIDFKFDKVGHINFYSPKTIRRLIQSCDLEILSQIVTNPSSAVYKYRSPQKGWLKHLVKESSITVAPGLATRTWTYHCALICKKAK